MFRIRRLIFNGLHRRNWTDAALLACVLTSVPLVILWLPMLRTQGVPEWNTDFSIIATIIILVFAQAISGGFTKKRTDDAFIWVGFCAFLLGAGLYHYVGHSMLWAALGLHLLGLFLVTRSLAGFVTRNRALETLGRVRRKSWGLAP